MESAVTRRRHFDLFIKPLMPVQCILIWVSSGTNSFLYRFHNSRCRGLIRNNCFKLWFGKLRNDRWHSFDLATRLICRLRKKKCHFQIFASFNPATADIVMIVMKRNIPKFTLLMLKIQFLLYVWCQQENVYFHTRRSDLNKPNTY